VRILLPVIFGLILQGSLKNMLNLFILYCLNERCAVHHMTIHLIKFTYL
jgi:hypothetical protein